MALLIGFLTFILVVNCLFLMLLVLVQLPKKEAGAGLAFGAGAVDTLIGAGSGNALTKLTKYSATSFLALSVVLAVLNAQRSHSGSVNLERELSRKASSAPMLPVTPNTPPATGSLNNAAAPAAAASNVLQNAPAVAPQTAPQQAPANTNALVPLPSPAPATTPQ